MLEKYSGKRFKKQFPNLKQVINDREIDFDMSGQVPLRLGTNEVYLKDRNNRRTTLTVFNVNPANKYAFKIEYNVPYIVSKIKYQFIVVFALTILISLAMQIVVSASIILSLLVSVITMLVLYYIFMNRLVTGLGISAYKIEVIETKL